MVPWSPEAAAAFQAQHPLPFGASPAMPYPYCTNAAFMDHEVVVRAFGRGAFGILPQYTQTYYYGERENCYTNFSEQGKQQHVITLQFPKAGATEVPRNSKNTRFSAVGAPQTQTAHVRAGRVASRVASHLKLLLGACSTGGSGHSGQVSQPSSQSCCLQARCVPQQ